MWTKADDLAEAHAQYKRWRERMIELGCTPPEERELQTRLEVVDSIRGIADDFDAGRLTAFACWTATRAALAKLEEAE